MILTSEHLEKAIIYATEKHKGVTRKGNGRPYIMHPISVMYRLMEVKSTSKNVYLLSIATLLHDVVEDCFDGDFEKGLTEIGKLFGFQVAGIVEELTSDKVQIEMLGKKEYLLKKMVMMSSYSLCIKLCDRLDNLNDMSDMSIEFKQKQVEHTQYIIDGLKSSRVLTKTHQKIIKMIEKILHKFNV